jgi:HEAT repeat protein
MRNGDVRQAAAEALGKIGARAVEPLIAALKDKE